MAPKNTTVVAPVVADVSAIVDVKANKDIKKAKKIAEVAGAEVATKPKKAKKTEVMRTDDVFQAVIDSGKISIEEFQKDFGKKLSIKSKFSTKVQKEKKVTQRSLFYQEYKQIKGHEKASLVELINAWNLVKVDPKSKYFVDITKKAVNKYEGLKPGDAIPEKEGYIMGENSRPVKKDSQTGIEVSKKFPNGNGVAAVVEEDAEDDDDSASEASEHSDSEDVTDEE